MTITQKNQTQRQVSRQGNGINGKEISKTTSRGTHITKQQQHRRGEREREKVKTHKPTRRTNIKQHIKPTERERKTEKPAMRKLNQDSINWFKIGAASGPQTAFASQDPLI